MKKLTALILSLFIISQSMSAFAWTISDEDGNVKGQEATPTETNEEDTEYEEWDTLEFLYSIGAVDENTISYSMLDDEINKLTFVMAVSGIYFYGDTGAGVANSVFSDIPKTHYAASDVSRLAAMGLISGNGDGTFGAEDTISLDQAYSIAVRMLGYGQYAESLGGFPTGSNSMAHTLDIEIEAEKRSAITVREAVQLLYNVMSCEMNTLAGIEGSQYNYKQGKLFMEEKMGIIKKRGIVNSSGAATLSGNVVGVGYALIGDDILSDEENRSYKYLGYNTEYFFNEENGLLWVSPYKTTALSIETSDDISYNDGYVYYGKDVIKKAKLSPDEISILYNGVAASSINDIVPEYGEVTLIDNDRDGMYEAAIVYDYTVYYLASMSKDKLELNLKDGTQTVVKNLDDYDTVTLLDESGDTISSLKAKNIVMIAENGTNIIAILCESTLSGKVTEEINENGDTYWVVDGEKLMTLNNAYFDAWNGLPMNITAHLDKYGSIAAAFAEGGADSAKEWKIGWLVQIIQDEAEENTFLAKFVDMENSDILTYQFADKFKVDGVQKTPKNGYNPKDVISERGVVRYLIADGKIKALDLPEYKPFSDTSKVVDNEFDKLYLRISGQRYYVEAQNTMVKDSASLAGDGNVYFPSGNVIYDAPARSDALTAKGEDITVIKTNAFTDHVYYDIDAYSVGSDSGYSDAVVVYGHNLSAGKTSSVGAALVVTEIKKGLDEEEMPTGIISGYVMGSKVEYMISRDGLTPDSLTYGVVTSFSSVKPGDIIKFTTDRYSRVNWIQKIWSDDGTGYVNKYGWTAEGIFGVYRYVKADVVNYKDGIISYNIFNGNFEMNRLGGAPTFVYDRSAKGSDAYKAASSTDLELATYPGAYEAVLIGSYHTFVKEVILIKK